MATCKDCLHYDVCEALAQGNGIMKVSPIHCGCFKPASNFAEVKRGEWEVRSDEYEICASEFVCSKCKESFVSSELTDEQFFEMMKFCPNCGADMRPLDKH